jgi:hypothetical protein
MLAKQDLIDNFCDVLELGSGVFRCQDETPRSTYYYYVKPAGAASTDDLLLISESWADDDFALNVLRQVPFGGKSQGIKSQPLGANSYGFSRLLLASSDYHAYFKGILDDRRDSLVLCLPFFDGEFTGNESVQDFFHMRRQMVPTMNWKRAPCPKVLLYFDNPKTGSGTGDKEVLVKHETLLHEIDNLHGVPNGFIEVTNSWGSVVEVLSPSPGQWIYIRDRNDDTREALLKPDLLKRLWDFVQAAAPQQTPG